MSERTVKPVVRVATYTANLSRSTHEHLDDFLNQQTLLWNCALQERIEAYEKGVKIRLMGKKLNHIWKHGYIGQMPSLTKIRETDEWFDRYSCSAQRSILIRLDKAFQNFFRRCKNGEKPGYPKFKGRRRKVRSFDTEQRNIKWGKNSNRVRVKGIGTIRFRGEKPAGTVTMMTIKKTPRRVEIKLTYEMPACEATVHKRDPVGIDLGVNKRIAFSTGGKPIPERKVDRKKEKELRRKVSSAKKGSNIRKKLVRQLSKETDRQKESTRHQLHRMTSEIVKQQGSNIIMEDLDIRKMTKKEKGKKDLNRRILEQNWGMLTRMLDYKTEDVGGSVQKVNPYNTSQTCSSCFKLRSSKLPPHEKVFDCSFCGHTEDRDVNAAKNIKRLGLTGKLH